MYSVVLMTALVTTTGTATWHNRGQHHCSVAACSCSCYGGYGGYAGYAGYSGYAGYAGYGCHGCHGYAAPIQGYGAAGGCYGYHGGCYGGYGHVYADPYFGGGGGCYGCYGGHSGYGVPLPGLVAVPGAKLPVVRDPFPAINPKKEEKDVEEIPPLKEKGKDKKSSDGKPKLDDSVRAKVRVVIPQGGKLFVDGQPINVAAGVRTFQTPALEAGQAYYYDIRIEVVENGVLRREERRVIINPGEDALVSFPSLRSAGTNTAQARP